MNEGWRGHLHQTGGIDMNFQELLLRHCVRAMDNQMALRDLIGDNHEWQFNMDSGQITFNQKHHFKTQLMGTEAYSSGTWLWAWANLESGIPESLLNACLMLKDYGAKNELPVFSQEEVTLDENHNGSNFSMIASGLYKADALYRGPYDGGALFLLIKDENYPKPKQHPAQRIVTVFPQVISGMSISNHRYAFAYYLNSYGLQVEQDGSAVIGKHPDGSTITATFDDQRRLTKLSTTLKGK
jgi:hypothetical protein